MYAARNQMTIVLTPSEADHMYFAVKYAMALVEADLEQKGREAAEAAGAGTHTSKAKQAQFQVDWAVPHRANLQDLLNALDKGR